MRIYLKDKEGNEYFDLISIAKIMNYNKSKAYRKLKIFGNNYVVKYRNKHYYKYETIIILMKDLLMRKL